MKTIHYISYYNCEESGRLLETQPSSVSKVDYIADSLIKAGFNVHIVSLSEGNLHSKFKLNHIGSILVEQNKRVFFFVTFYFIVFWLLITSFLRYTSYDL